MTDKDPIESHPFTTFDKTEEVLRIEIEDLNVVIYITTNIIFFLVFVIKIYNYKDQLFY